MKSHSLNFFPACVILAVILTAIVPGLVFANEENGIIPSTELVLQASTRPEIKLGITQSWAFPFLRGSNPLVSGNNIKPGVSFEVTPVGMAGLAQFVWTPIAFLEISGGGKFGTGWNLPIAYGIGLNVPMGTPGSGPGPNGERKSEIDASPFDGLQWRAWAGGTFQFDLGAVVPGDWNHIVFRAYTEMRYSGYSRAGKNDAWIMESDDGDNMNGWISYSSFVLGYQIPRSPVLKMAAFMFEMDFNFYDVPNKVKWGGDKGRFIISSVLNFDIIPRLNAMLAVQMRTRRNYGTSDYENDSSLWYRDMTLQDKGGKTRLVFYRVALILNYKIF